MIRSTAFLQSREKKKLSKQYCVLSTLVFVLTFVVYHFTISDQRLGALAYLAGYSVGTILFGIGLTHHRDSRTLFGRFKSGYEGVHDD